MTNQEYNGWHNYETWAVNLHLSNDQGSADYWREQTDAAIKQAGAEKLRGGLETFTISERATLILSDLLKENHEENAPELTGIYADLMGAVMSEVNWHEIAKHMVMEYFN